MLVNKSLQATYQYGCRSLASLLILALLSACASGPSQDGWVAPGETTAIPREAILPDQSTSSAVKGLLEQARTASQAQQFQKSESLLERALRIEPGNAVLWHYMAKVHLYQEHFERAAGLALRSNSLATADKILQADNWRIILHARSHLGDAAGAQMAQQHLDAIQTK